MFTDDQFNRLMDVLKEIRDAQRSPIPLTPNDVWEPAILPNTPTMSPVVTCNQCGMQFEGVMGYVCSRAGCPVGAGPTMC